MVSHQNYDYSHPSLRLVLIHSNISALKTINVGFYTPSHKTKMGP